MTLDTTRPVQTRCGRPARILATNLNDPRRPLVVAINYPDRDTEYVTTRLPDGKDITGTTSNLDIINTPVKHTRRVYFYRSAKGHIHAAGMPPDARRRWVPEGEYLGSKIVTFTEGEEPEEEE